MPANAIELYSAEFNNKRQKGCHLLTRCTFCKSFDICPRIQYHDKAFCWRFKKYGNSLWLVGIPTAMCVKEPTEVVQKKDKLKYMKST
jgi:hypothetical protein